MSTPTQTTGGDSSTGEEESGGGGGYSMSNEAAFGDTSFGAVSSGSSGPVITFPSAAAVVESPTANKNFIVGGIVFLIALALYLIFGRDK